MNVLMLAWEKFMETILVPGFAQEFGVMIAVTMILGYFMRYRASFLRNWMGIAVIMVVFLVRIVNTIIQVDAPTQFLLWVITGLNVLLFMGALLFGGFISRIARLSISKKYTEQCISKIEALS